MNSKTVIHIVGAASSQSHCLSELSKKIGGAKLIFSYTNFLKSNKSNLETDCIDWIQDQVKDNDIILTCGLHSRAAKTWIKKAYPKDKFQHLIWEVHHEKESEKQIVKERSWALLLDGLLTQGRQAIKRGIPSNHELIKSTPLSIAIEFESNKKLDKSDVNELIKSLADQQEKNNLIQIVPDLICAEAFNPTIRTNCINKISQLVTNIHQLKSVS